MLYTNPEEMAKGEIARALMETGLPVIGVGEKAPTSPHITYLLMTVESEEQASESRSREVRRAHFAVRSGIKVKAGKSIDDEASRVLYRLELPLLDYYPVPGSTFTDGRTTAAPIEFKPQIWNRSLGTDEGEVMILCYLRFNYHRR